MQKNLLLVILLFVTIIVSCKKETEPSLNSNGTIPPTTPDPKIKAIYDTLNSKQWAGTNTANNKHIV